jgi:asparagine synthetase B (glutamine-hydrolysing)
MEWLTEDQIGQFDARLDRAVDRALSAGPAGIFLSGGLDSISIAAFASDRARRSGRPGPRALSLAFPDSACDERHIQTAVARQLGMPHHLLDFWQAVGSGGLFSEALALNRDVSMPVLNIWGPAYHTLARQGRANGVRTILTGMGGDEWLSVSSMLSADLISRGDLRGLTRHVRTMMRSYSRTASQTLHNQLWSNGLRPLMSRALYRLAPGPWQRSRLGRQVRSDPAWISPDPALRTRQVERAAGSLETADPPGGFYLRELRTSLDHPLMSWELDEQYEFGKLVGVQYHHPYWDVDLVETLFKTPPALLDRGGRSKGLVREALAKRFPTLGFERQRKVAATNFFRSVVAKEGAALIDAVGDVSTLDALGVVDGPPAIAAARKAVTGTPAEWFSAWSLLNLETWARQQVH